MCNLLGVGIIYILTEREGDAHNKCTLYFLLFFVSICLVEVLFWVEVLLFVTMLGVGILSD